MESCPYPPRYTKMQDTHVLWSKDYLVNSACFSHSVAADVSMTNWHPTETPQLGCVNGSPSRGVAGSWGVGCWGKALSNRERRWCLWCGGGGGSIPGM